MNNNERNNTNHAGQSCPACFTNLSSGVMKIADHIQIPLLCASCNHSLSEEEITELFNRALNQQITNSFVTFYREKG